MASRQPVIGITMGDAAGIGPEVVVKALTAESISSKCRCVIIGDAAVLGETSRSLNCDIKSKDIEIFDLKNLPDRFDIGVDSPVTGRASAEYIEAAVRLWQERKIDAICTAPISKKALAMAGYDFPGHTELLASLTNAKKFAMSFFGGDLRVVLHSTHLSLREAIERVKKDSLIDLIEFSAGELGKLLGRTVRLAVAGLNPHASEGGMFGFEELREVKPAVDHCRSELNIDVSGPYSPDTIFLRGFNGEFDAVIALYHDQATIAVKSLAFGSAVNVTLGLPLVRTSVDHE